MSDETDDEMRMREEEKVVGGRGGERSYSQVS